jgi:protein angel
VEFHHLYKKCPVESLDESVRRMIVLKEMIHFKPDVVCLQEITEAWFEFFQENLAEENYGCKFTKKTQNKPDGCATFYKKDVFTLHAFDVIKFEEVYFQNDKPRPNIAQMVCLQSVRDQGKRVAVGNTHLIYNPKRQDVRLLHIHEFSKKHLEFREMHGASSGILCGDLNDNPSSHCCRYLSGQTIKYWSDAVIFKPNVKWNSAYRLINEEHRHTSFNHTGEVTDYIWFDGNLNLTEALGTHYKHLSPVPSEIIPSDHLPVMAKFKH